MKKISIYLAASLIIVAGIIGYSAGYLTTPEYRLTMNDKALMELGPADRWLDLRYLNTMIAHHEKALAMAQQAVKNAQHAEVKALAQWVVDNKPAAIKQLYQYKKDWYNDTRPARPMPVPDLGGPDVNFDLRYINAFASGLDSGIALTQDVRLKTTRQEITTDADNLENLFKDVKKQLTDWRKLWYTK